MTNDPETYPYLITLIWQQDGPNPSPTFNSRLQGYGITGLPTTVFGGSDNVAGGGAMQLILSEYVPAYNAAASIPSPMELQMQSTRTGNFVDVSVNVEMLDNITTTNNRILFILTHDFTGTQNPDYFASVVRYHEQLFPLTSTGENRDFTQRITLLSAWDIERCNIVVVVQAMSGNRIIHQAGKLSVPPEMGAPENLTYDFHNASTPPEVALNWEEPAYSLTTLETFHVYKNDVFYSATTELNYIDQDIELNTEITYHVLAIYEHGESLPSNQVVVSTTVSTADHEDIPLVTRLVNNFPNPFNPSTTIAFDLAFAGHVRLEIYNIKGQKVRTLVDGMLSTGAHQIQWNGQDDQNQNVASGVYFYLMQTDETTDLRRMVLMK